MMVRKEPRSNLMDLIETKANNFGASLGLVDDTIPPVGSKAYNKLKVNKLMDEDCISMRNEPIDPLETIEDMQFDFNDLIVDDDNNNNNRRVKTQSMYESRRPA